MTIVSTTGARIPRKKWSSPHKQQKSPKYSTWMLAQKWQENLFTSKASHSASQWSSLCLWCQRSWSWSVLWRPRRPPRNNTWKRYSIHHQGLEWKRRKSRYTWNTRQVWPWRTDKAGQRLTELCQETALVIANTLFQQLKRGLYTWTSLN